MEIESLFGDRKRGRRRSKKKKSGRATAAFGDKRPLVGKRVLGKLGGHVAPRSTRTSFIYATKGGVVYEARVSKRAKSRKPAKKKSVKKGGAKKK